jgi:putative transposase
MTPSTVHYGRADSCNQQRQAILHAAYSWHPERFVRGLPRTLSLPESAWINPPELGREPDEKGTEYGVNIIGGAG